MLQKFKSLTSEELRELYSDRSTREIANQFGIGPEVVRKALVRNGIPRRPRGGVRTFNPPKSELYDLYQENTMKQIANIYGVGETVVWTRLREHGIVLKDHEEGGHRIKRGRVFSPEHRAAMSRARTGKYGGDKSPRWKGGAAAENLRLRSTGAYKQWRLNALELRGSKCQDCGVQNKSVCPCCMVKVTLHVHHVLSFAAHPERRFDPENSEVLCPKCHHARHHGKTA